MMITPETHKYLETAALEFARQQREKAKQERAKMQKIFGADWERQAFEGRKAAQEYGRLLFDPNRGKAYTDWEREKWLRSRGNSNLIADFYDNLDQYYAQGKKREIEKQANEIRAQKQLIDAQAEMAKYAGDAYRRNMGDSNALISYKAPGTAARANKTKAIA